MSPAASAVQRDVGVDLGDQLGDNERDVEDIVRMPARAEGAAGPRVLGPGREQLGGQVPGEAGGRMAPVSLDCKPLEYRNVALTADNHAALAAEADRLVARLCARPALPPLLHADLTRRRDAIHAFLTATNGGTT